MGAAGFAVAQLGLSLALVTGALMLVATLRNLNAIDVGVSSRVAPFTDTEALTPARASAVAIVSQKLARRLFGKRDAGAAARRAAGPHSYLLAGDGWSALWMS